jgi:hypothetical protein
MCLYPREWGPLSRLRLIDTPRPVALSSARSASPNRPASPILARIAAMARNKEISLDAANDLIAQESRFLEAESGGDLEAQVTELKDTVARLAPPAPLHPIWSWSAAWRPRCLEPM